MNNYCQLWLTCKDEKEAQKIADALLVKGLVACVHKVPVSSDFRWKGKIQSSKEVLLIMDSREGLFDEIERVILVLHSYDTFVLQSIPLNSVSKKAEQWLNQELQK